MKILATGHPDRILELQQKLASQHTLDTISGAEVINNAPGSLAGYDLLFDLDLDDHVRRLAYYAPLKGQAVVVCSVKQTLRQMSRHCNDEVHCTLIGMNTLPTFIHRPVAEVALLHERDAQAADAVFGALHWEYRLVKDQPGMVTPRVLAMLINEACFVLEEQTACRDDIDAAMKLGTNYPYGPLEWCDRIGIREVYETLHAVAVHSGGERYRICDLLKERYLDGQPFYKP